MSTFSTIQGQVEALFIGYFQRPGDPAGEQYWENQLINGMSWLGAAASFSVQLEAQNDYPFLATDGSNVTNIQNFITSVYNDLFNRAPDAAGLAYWTAQLQAAHSPQAIGEMILNIISGAPTGSADDLTLQNKVQVASYITNFVGANGLTWTPTLQAEAAALVAATTNASSGAGSASFEEAAFQTFLTTQPTTYNLTTGVDVVTATGSTLNGVAAPNATGSDIIQGLLGNGATLNAFDDIAPGGTNNSMSLVDSGGSTLPLGATISNIQSMTLQDQGNAGGGVNSRFDVSGVSGLTQFTATSVGANTDYYKAGTGTNVNATALAGNINLSGGLNDTVNAAGTATVANAAGNVNVTAGGNATVTGTTGTVNVTSGGNVSITGGTNVVASADGSVTVSGETGTVQVMDTAAFGTVTVNNGTSVSVTAEGNISIGATTAPLGAITATIDGPVALENALPSVTADGGTGATVNTTGGNVSLGTTSAPIAGNVFITDTNTGPSTDAFTVLATGGVNLNTTPTSGNIVIGFDSKLNAAGTALADADDPTGNVVVSNTETFGKNTYFGSSTVQIGTNGATSVSVTGAGTTTITDEETTAATGGANAGKAIGGSTLASVSLNHDGTTTITSDALTSLSISNMTGSVTVNEVATPTGTPANALLLTLSAASPTVTDNTASAVTVATSGTTADGLTLNASNATTLTFDNGAALGFTAGGLGAVTSIVADNTGSLALGSVSGLTALTSINATGSQGAVSVELAEGASSKVSFNGAGGGLDTVTIDSNTLGTGTSIAGATGSTLVANYVASGNDTPLGTNSHISGFSTLALGTLASSDTAGQPFTQLVGNNVLSATVTITGNWVAGNTVSLDITAGPGTVGSPYTYTVTAGQTDSQIAAGLAAAALASGDMITYGGANSFTISASSAFTANTSTNLTATTGSVSAITVTTAGVAPTDQTVTFAVSGTGTGTGDASITLNGVTSDVTTTLNETAQQVANALVAAINASSVNSQVTASDAGGTSTTVTVTANTAGAPGPVTSDSSSGPSAGITVGAGSNTAGTSGTAQVEHFTVSGTYAAGNVISYSFAGDTGTYTVSSGDAASDQTLANDLASAIETAYPALTATDGGTTTITVTDSPNAPFTDNISVANGSTGVATLTGTSGSYDATGFTALTTGNTAGDVTFLNVAAGVGLSVTATNAHIINYELKTLAATNTLPLTVGVDGSSTGLTDTVATTGIQNLNIASVGKSGTNTLTIDDSAAKAITVTGDGALTLTLKNDAGGGFTSSVTSISAAGSSAAVNVNGVGVSTAGATFTGGTGLLTATGSSSSGAVDVFNIGSGGGVINLGQGGANVNVAPGANNIGNYLISGSGSETVNLLANNPVGSVIGVGANTVATVNNFNITNFVTNDDSLYFYAGPETILANHTITAVASQGISNISGDLKYSVSNGVITFSGTTLDPLSNFTLSQLVGATAELEGAHGIAAFQYNGSTYVVATGSTPLGQPPAADDVSVTILSGVTGVQGFGSTTASNTIYSSNVVNLAANSANSGNATAVVYNETGYAIFDDSLQNVLGTASTTLNNLAASGQLNIGTSETALIVNQVGASGTNSLTIDATGSATIGTLTLNGDDFVTINAATPHSLTINSLVDNTGTLGKLAITGTGTVTIGGVTSTALNTVDDSGQTGGSFTLTDALNGQTIKLGTDTVALTANGQGDAISAAGTTTETGQANGDGDTIALAGTVGSSGSHFSASGLADAISISGSGTVYLDANNNGDTIKLGTGASTVSATGSGDTIVFGNQVSGSSSVTVGADATVTFGTTSNTHTEDVILTANTVTGTTSGGNFNITVLSGVTATGYELVSSSNNAVGALDHVTSTAVDVAAVGTLAQALDAVSALNTATATGQNYWHWFEFGGNTYVVDNVGTGSALTAMGAHDSVIEITGLVNLSNIHATLAAFGQIAL